MSGDGYNSGSITVHSNNFTLVHKMASWGVSYAFCSRASEGNAINPLEEVGLHAQQWYGATTHTHPYSL